MPDGSHEEESPRGRTALVLSGGGARAAYQVGVLRYIARRQPEATFPIVTGVSAGAINAFFLASHRSNLESAARGLSEHWCALTTRRVMRSDPLSLLRNVVRVTLNLSTGGSRLVPSVRGLVDTRPLRGYLTGLLDADGVEDNIRKGRLHALAISATSYQTGQIISFVQAPPGVRMWERVRRRAVPAKMGISHVMASAAIPLFFPACRIDGEYYGDGSLRQSHPLAPAVHLGADRILAVSSRSHLSGREARASVIVGYPPAARIIGLMLNSIFLDNLDVDAERLKRINHILTRVPPSRRWLLAERHVRLLVLRPSRDIGRLAAEHEEELPRALRFLIRGLGTRRSGSADLLSYVLFESEYLSKLIRLGEEDAHRQWLRIRRFLGWETAADRPA